MSGQVYAWVLSESLTIPIGRQAANVGHLLENEESQDWLAH